MVIMLLLEEPMLPVPCPAMPDELASLRATVLAKRVAEEPSCEIPPAPLAPSLDCKLIVAVEPLAVIVAFVSMVIAPLLDSGVVVMLNVLELLPAVDVSNVTLPELLI